MSTRRAEMKHAGKLFVSALASAFLLAACGDGAGEGSLDSPYNPIAASDGGAAPVPGNGGSTQGGANVGGGSNVGGAGNVPGGSNAVGGGNVQPGQGGAGSAGDAGGSKQNDGGQIASDATTPFTDAGPSVPGGGSQPSGSEADYKDPGKGPWEKVTPDKCKLDMSKLNDSNIATYAIFRYGKLCHMKGGDAAGSMFSATKTLGGTTVGRAAYLTRDVMRTGPGTGTIKHEDKATEWLGSVSYNRDATLAHVMSMCGHSTNLAYGMKRFDYDTIGSTQINTMMAVTEKAIKQVPAVSGTFTAFMKKELFDRMGMTKSTYSNVLGISSGWEANLSDMGKLGTLLLHDGWYGGERLLSREWVYRMSHPAFEDANTSYGQLAWLNHRGNAAGIGGNISTGSNAKEGDPCAPAAFWPEYPHVPSGAPDCRATVGSCKQKYDVGIFSAQGLNGQFIVIHPGLDMVITARDFSGGDGPLGLWKGIRPALVAMDPMFKGDEAAFCKAYGAGDYAPDLVMPRHP